MRRFCWPVLAAGVAALGWTALNASPPDTPKTVLLVSFPTDTFTSEAVEAIRNCCAANRTKAVKTCGAGETCEMVRIKEADVSSGFGDYKIVFEHEGKNVTYPQSFSGNNEHLYHLAVMDGLKKFVTCHLFTAHSIDPPTDADSPICRRCAAVKLPSDLLNIRKDPGTR